MEGADAVKELTADLVGDYLFSDADFVNRLSTENRSVFQKVFDEIKYLCRVATAGSKEARQLEKVKKTFEEAYKAAKNTVVEDGAKYSLNIKHTDGMVEELADARSLTDEQAISYLTQAKKGELKRETYIPVRKDTPQVIIDTLASAGESVENLSLVMQVRKAQQAMSAENSGNRSGKHGNNVRKHALTPAEVVEIVNNLDNPNMVILQTNRQGKNGEQLSNNVAVFVEYSNDGKEGVAVIEFESSINPEFIGTEFGDTSYHTVVTVFEPDTERNGVEFDYAEELLSNPNNRELEIVRKQPAGSATGEKHPNTSSELLSDNSIRNSGKGVNTKFSLSEADQAYTDAVSRGDTAAAQKLVDQAAKDAGYTIKGYHGSPARFTVFDKNRVGKGTDQFGAGFYFGTTDEIAKAYGGEQYEVYLDIKKPIKVYRTAGGGDLYDVEITPTQAYKIAKKHPLMYDAEESPLGDFFDTYWETGPKEWMVRELAKNYTSIGLLDGDLFREYPNELHEAIREILGYDGVDVSFDNADSKFYVAWFDNQMKSAEPVTYDDSGNMILLSERFNTDSNDIRYSLSSEGDIAPVGNWQIRGEDVILRSAGEDLGPVSNSPPDCCFGSFSSLTYVILKGLPHLG